MQTIQLDKHHQSTQSDSARSTLHARAEWLEWMHNIFPDANALLLFQVNPNQTINCCAASPVNESPRESVTNAVLSSLHRQRPLYAALDAAAHVLAVPLLDIASSAQFVLVIETAALSEVQQSTAVKLTQWAASRLYKESGSSHAAQSASGPEIQLANAMVESLDRHGSLNALALRW